MKISEQQYPPMLRIHHLEALLGIERTTIYRNIRAGKFPRPLRGIVGRSAYWPLDEIRDLLRTRCEGASKS